MRATKAKRVESDRVRMKHGGQSAILDRGARKGVKEEVTSEQRLKVVREQESTGLGKEHSRKCKGHRQRQVSPVKGTRTLEC